MSCVAWVDSKSWCTALRPSCVITAGYDHMVKIWTRQGVRMSILRAYGTVPWRFPVQAPAVNASPTYACCRVDTYQALTMAAYNPVTGKHSHFGIESKAHLSRTFSLYLQLALLVL
eukprot:6456977-Amphidinium_carterae.1